MNVDRSDPPSRKPRILIAGTELAIQNFTLALQDDAALVAGRTVADALRLCDRDIDLVLCNVRFDESRMFELLEALHAKPVEQRIPVVCVRLFRPMTPAVLAGMVEALAVVGVRRFADFYELREREGLEAALAELRKAVLEEWRSPPAVAR